MSHQRASSTSSISSAFDTHINSNNQNLKGGMANTAGNSSTSVATPSTPLSVSIPRQRSFSSSFSLANSSPRGAFTGSSIIANPNNGFLNSSGVGTTTPFSAAFSGPLASPTSASFSSSSATTTTTAAASSMPASQTVPVLHRRFSSSFNQLNQIVGSPPNTQIPDRGRRTSLFGGSSPPMAPLTPTTQSSNEGNTKPGLFRKFSSSGRSAAPVGQHPFDRNDVGPANVGPQPNGVHHQISTAAASPGNNNSSSHLSPVDKLKPSQDKHSRSSSPMRSMILNGQMLD
ncbi:hypothetical protein BGX26_003290 [Mortierella sp. AD094]|nr:hypothetical protein BGX26_003290 [Mortierella sp. AD094]